MPEADRAGELTVRPATPADIDMIACIHTVARSAYYRGFVPEESLADPVAEERRRGLYALRMADPRYTMLCAEAGPDVAGFVILGPPREPAADPAHTGELLQIHVRPDLWRRGIGSALHRASVGVWQAASVTTARVDVWASNDRGRAFYASHGWQPDGHRREGPAGFDCIRLVLSIQPGLTIPAASDVGRLGRLPVLRMDLGEPDGVNIADELSRSREDER
jgi:ribosomal protein S18 acetylase RimI-like enzyme